MATIFKSHTRLSAASRLVSGIVFNEEFTHLQDELLNIYRKYNIQEPEKEAFEDAFYSFLNQQDIRQKALSF